MLGIATATAGGVVGHKVGVVKYQSSSSSILRQLNHVTKPRAHDIPSSVDRYFRAKCRQPSSRPCGPRTKKPKLEQEATVDVSPQSAEPANTAESDSDSDTE